MHDCSTILSKNLAKVCPLVFVGSKRLRVICFGYWSTPKKMISNAKHHVQHLTSIDQNLLQNDIFAKFGKTYSCLVLSTNPSSNSWENCFRERKTILGHKYILYLFNQLFSTNYKKRWFLMVKRLKSSKNYFWYKILFLERFFCKKN
jgi:hypothetical protein